MFYFFNNIFIREKQNYAADADVKMSMHIFPDGLWNVSHKQSQWYGTKVKVNGRQNTSK